MTAFHRIFGEAPSAKTYMLNAFRPSPGWNSERGCPDLRLSWHGYRVEPAAVDLLRATAEIGAGDSSSRLGILYPQVTGFRLIMAMLTHPAWPLPIWNALQVRNRLRLHAPLATGVDFELEAHPSGWRVLPRSLEIDIHMTLAQAGVRRWEGIVTFYYRGRFGAETEGGVAIGAGSSPPAVTGEAPEATSWNVGRDHRWRFAKLTGDYNGLHQWDWYARRMGFPAAFLHPQRVLGQCLARLPDPGPAPLELDVWIRGPVFFGRDVTMRHHFVPESGARAFGLWLEGESRPALLGTLRPDPEAADLRNT